MAHKKRYRNVNGLLLFDKPIGLTSNQALQRVKRLFSARKAGHTGSLDPIASGLLLLCFGKATKVSTYLLEADKHYRTVCRLGQKTTTADTEGEVIETRPVENYNDRQIEEVLQRYRGGIEQIPPMYSALKHQGKRLYELAREGVEVERQPRKVTIHVLELVSRDQQTLTLNIHCSKGTYVRTLVEDIGDELGCGAHVSELRRLGVGPYTEQAGMITLDELESLAEQGYTNLDSQLRPIETALTDWPALRLTGDMTFYARTGQPVLVPKSPASGMVRLYADDGVFFGMGMVLDDGRVAPKPLMVG